MERQTAAGFMEIEHTADWQLDVWAPSLSELFLEAAKGMYSLTGIRLADIGMQTRTITLKESDYETLLVTFLSELLYLAEQDGLGFPQIQISITDQQLEATLIGYPITQQIKEIKAVTYHDLNIKNEKGVYQVRVVFDV